MSQDQLGLPANAEPDDAPADAADLAWCQHLTYGMLVLERPGSSQSQFDPNHLPPASPARIHLPPDSPARSERSVGETMSKVQARLAAMPKRDDPEWCRA